ncbi:MAG TPA: DUF86 domain-containing protein [Herpetosiphonaceae bacterium]
MMQGDSIYLQHILDAIAKVEHYLQGIDETTFTSQSLVQDGVIGQIEIIGEAVKRVSPELRDRYARIPWRDTAGMRDKLIHHYFKCSSRLAHRNKRSYDPQSRSANDPTGT